MQQNDLTIFSIVVHRNQTGLYSLNDLHKAAGGAEKDRPRDWLRTKDAKEYLQLQMAKGGIPLVDVNQHLTVAAGSPVTGGGTFVSRRLAYKYASWVSGEFFDALVDGFEANQLREMESLQKSADAYAQLASSSDDMLISEAALTLEQPRSKFFEYLSDRLGWIYRRGGKWWPKQDAVQKGWMARRLHTYLEDGVCKKSYQTVITNAGLIKVQQGLLPA